MPTDFPPMQSRWVQDIPFAVDPTAAHWSWPPRDSDNEAGT